jgi:hypothetical protein
MLVESYTGEEPILSRKQNDDAHEHIMRAKSLEPNAKEIARLPCCSRGSKQTTNPYRARPGFPIDGAVYE